MKECGPRVASQDSILAQFCYNNNRKAGRGAALRVRLGLARRGVAGVERPALTSSVVFLGDDLGGVRGRNGIVNIRHV